MTENKRFTYLNYSRDGHIGSFYLNDKPITNKKVCGLLKKQEEEIQQLKQDLNKKVKFVAKQESGSSVRVDFDEFVQLCKDSNDLKEKEERIKELETRNQRQYNSLTELSDLMMKRDWKGLEKIVEDWEESERLLQTEFPLGCGDR